MEDLFGFSEQKDELVTQFGTQKQQQSSNNILDDIFGNTTTKNDIEYPQFFQPKTKQSTTIQPTSSKPNESQQQTNISTDTLWDYIDNPNPNNDISKLFSNVSKPNAKSKTNFKNKLGISNLRPQGMLTKEIKQISKICPAAKYFISSYFKYECLMEDDIIIPECVEILAIMYLGHPAFIHAFLCDESGEPLLISRKLFIVFGYHTLNNLIDEYLNTTNIKHITQLQKKKNETKYMATESVISELFNITQTEKERRIWRRDIKMPIPTYNGSYREIFDHIDELFFDDDMMENNVVQYNDWDEFLEIDDGKKEKKLDDWVIVVGSVDILFDTKNGVSEIEILIEQKDVLSDWVRHYEAVDELFARKNDQRFFNDNILKLKPYR